MKEETVLDLLRKGAQVREIELGRYTLYVRPERCLIHDNAQKRAINRVVFTGTKAEGIAEFLRLTSKEAETAPTT